MEIVQAFHILCIIENLDHLPHVVLWLKMTVSLENPVERLEYSHW
jgi:hypothetical protein